VKNSTSELLIENCDEFIFYEDLVRVQQRPMPVLAGGALPEKLQDCFNLLVDSVSALQRENKEVLWGSMVKETMKRKRPSFNESYYGFRSFSHLLEDAQRRGIVILRRDQKSGSYVIEDLGAAAAAKTDTTSAAEPVVERKAEAAVAADGEGANGARGPRRRRGRGGRGRRTGAPAAPGSVPEGGASGADDGDDDSEDDTEDTLTAEDADRSHAPAEPRETPAAEAPSERPAFSLFAWLKRDGEDKKPT